MLRLRFVLCEGEAGSCDLAAPEEARRLDDLRREKWGTSLHTEGASTGIELTDGNGAVADAGALAEAADPRRGLVKGWRESLCSDHYVLIGTSRWVADDVEIDRADLGAGALLPASNLVYFAEPSGPTHSSASRPRGWVAQLAVDPVELKRAAAGQHCQNRVSLLLEALPHAILFLAPNLRIFFSHGTVPEERHLMYLKEWLEGLGAAYARTSLEDDGSSQANLLWGDWVVSGENAASSRTRGRPPKSVARGEAFRESLGLSHLISGHQDLCSVTSWARRHPSPQHTQGWVESEVYAGAHNLAIDPSPNAADATHAEIGDVVDEPIMTLSSALAKGLKHTTFLVLRDGELGASMKCVRGATKYDADEPLAAVSDVRNTCWARLELKTLSRIVERAERVLCAGEAASKPSRVDYLLVHPEEADVRAIVVGDLHGCIDSICRVLAYAKAEQYFESQGRVLRKGHYLVFLGDLVDRGSYSAQCVALVLHLVSLNPRQVLVVQGNHETCKMHRSADQNYLLGQIGSMFRGSRPAEGRFVWQVEGSSSHDANLLLLVRSERVAAEVLHARVRESLSRKRMEPELRNFLEAALDHACRHPKSATCRTFCIELISALDYAHQQARAGSLAMLRASIVRGGNYGLILRKLAAAAKDPDRIQAWFVLRVLAMDAFCLGVILRSASPLTIFYGGKKHAETLGDCLLDNGYLERPDRPHTARIPFVLELPFVKQYASSTGDRQVILLGEQHMLTSKVFSVAMLGYMRSTCHGSLGKVTLILEKHISNEADALQQELTCNMDMAIHVVRCDAITRRGAACPGLQIVDGDNRHIDLGFLRFELLKVVHHDKSETCDRAARALVCRAAQDLASVLSLSESIRGGAGQG